MTARLVVLVSGNGSNLQAVLDAAERGTLDAEVVAVVSNRPAVRALDRAELAGVPSEVLEREGRPRREYDEALGAVVAAHQPDLIVLAGWMRILTGAFLAKFSVINLHPALPGMFPGTNAIERAFNAWHSGEILESGVMVHWVPDEGVDTGPTIAEAVVPFETEDTLEQFEERMHRTEHALLIKALGMVIDGSADPVILDPQIKLALETS